MTTRRNFLAANLIGAAGWAWDSGRIPGSPTDPAPLPATPGARSDRDFWNDWPAYLGEKMNQARSRRLAQMAAVQSGDQARERVSMIRSKIWELIGGPLEKTPLNARVTGKINRGLYRIEKVIFESLPKVYVTANLYIPASGKSPFPAVLAPLGHTDDGKAYRSYQYLYQNLARKGYVVLAFDPYGQGERFQYIDGQTGRSRYGTTGEHSQAGRPLILLGNTFALYRAWDGIRALDYLVSRPEVDANRVGCTGHSGGGTMTMYLAALEPRLRVAVEVEGNSENMAGPFYDPPGTTADAEQNIVGGLPRGLDRGDLLWAFAPKPLLLCYTTHDEGETYSPLYEESAREIYQELQRVYGLLGAKEKVAIFASHLPHDLDFFHRRETYGWFNRWLGNPEAGTEEAEFDASPEGSLNCTSTGQVLTSLGGRSVVQVNVDLARQMIPESPFRSVSADVVAVQRRIRDDLTQLLALPRQRWPLHSRILSSNPRKGMVIEEFQFESEPGVRVTGWFVAPSPEGPRRPTVLYLTRDGGDDVVAEPGSMDRLLASGHAVCAITLRGLGIATPRFPKAGPRFYSGGRNMDERFAWASLALGLPVIGQRVWDTLRAFDYLASRADVAQTQIRVLGTEGAGLVAAMAAVLDNRPRSVLVDRTLVSYASIVESEDYSLAQLPRSPAGFRRFWEARLLFSITGS
ncbi:MAG: acetylxylan esterase, partial [Terriglobia bacterium]